MRTCVHLAVWARHVQSFNFKYNLFFISMRLNFKVLKSYELFDKLIYIFLNDF